MVIKLKTEKGILIGISETDGKIIEYGKMPVPRVKINPIDRKPRWLKGSLLTTEQKIDEEFTRKVHIA